ncbi:MAG: hypothetical protein EOO11_13020 [Chitinophagaceae bacterium]|nr:MAG: hypothetical protein EOO11_13020 [Chitinophagaceae bacterium]
MNALYSTCTVSHLFRAKPLSDSIRAQHPELPFYICIVDPVAELQRAALAELFAPHTLLYTTDLPAEYYNEIDPTYRPFEFTCAFRPVFAWFLMADKGHERVIYLDSDTCLYGRLDKSFADLDRHNIILTPHNDKLLDYEWVYYDQGVLRSGIFNSGFVAMKDTGETRKFLQWWMKRLQKLCQIDPQKGLFVDQIWLNLVPLYFEGVLQEKDPGYNVAYFNIFHRSVSFREGRYWVNETHPLIFFHYTGLQHHDPASFSLHFLGQTLEQWPELKPLFEPYRLQTIAAQEAVHRIMGTGAEEPKPTLLQKMGGLFRKKA